MHNKKRKKTQGQSIIEYLIVLLAIFIAMVAFGGRIENAIGDGMETTIDTAGEIIGN